MHTLTIRNVPEDVVASLKDLARAAGTSVNAVAVQELSDAARRTRNRELLRGLPDMRVPPAEILAALDDGRDGDLGGIPPK